MDKNDFVRFICLKDESSKRFNKIMMSFVMRCLYYPSVKVYDHPAGDYVKMLQTLMYPFTVKFCNSRSFLVEIFLRVY